MKKIDIKLYGPIDQYDNNAERFVQSLSEAQAKKPEVIRLHVHSPGGDVFEGNLIYNAIKNSSVPVDVYVDGIAASMASVIMLAARKVYIAQNGFVMIHAPHTFECGNAEDLEKSAKLLRDIEDIFVDVLAGRTGKTDDDVRAWLQGDNWFNAQEALDEKLVDGIVGQSDIRFNEDEEHLKKTSTNALWQRFAAITDIYKPKKEQEMDKEALIARLQLSGVTAQSSDEEVQAAIEAKIQAGEQKVEALRKEQIKAAIDKAVLDKKISETQRATYEAIGESNGIEVLEKVLADIRVMPQSINGQLGKQGGTPSDRSGWTWEKWQTEDPRGLEALQTSDPEAFKALLEGAYGKQ